MKYDEFIGQVQHRARLGTRWDAERATWATLKTLGERLADGEAKDLASQLPSPLAQFESSGLAGQGIPFSLSEFYQIVSNREGVDIPQAMRHAQAVISVLQEAISAGELHDIRAQLPKEYTSLFETETAARSEREG